MKKNIFLISLLLYSISVFSQKVNMDNYIVMIVKKDEPIIWGAN